MKLTDEVLRAWVDEGLVSEEQAEVLAGVSVIDRSPRRARPLALIAEGLGYLGGALAAGAAGAIASTFWADLETLAQLALLALVSGLLLAAGSVTGGIASAPMKRLGSLLWLLSAAAVSGGLWLGLFEYLDLDERLSYLVASVAATAYAGGLWLRRPRCLQQLGLGAGMANLAVALLAQPEHPPGPEWFGLAFAALGVAWLALAWGQVVRPERTAVALGSVALLGGAQAIALSTAVGIVLGLAFAGALLAGGVVHRRMVAVGFGAAGVLLFVPQAVGHWFGDTLPGALTVLVVGLAFLATGIGIARTKAAR